MTLAPKYSGQLLPPVQTVAIRNGDGVALAPVPVATDRPPLSSGKALVIGASIGLIFLLGRLGKK